MTTRISSSEKPEATTGGKEHAESADGTHIAADGQRVSRTGAALGRPELEEGQYGLKKPGGSDIPEREMRGVQTPQRPKPA